MHVLGQKLLLQLVDIAYLGHRHYGEAPKMAVDDNRLRVGVAYYTYSTGTLEFVEVPLELGTEITALEIVD